MFERPYQRLVAWKEAYNLCLSIYRLTKKFPSEEKFGLVSQMRRAASSAPFNIAEGNAKRSTKEKRYYFEIVLASLDELHCECMLSRDLKHISQEEFDAVDEHIHRVSYLIGKLRSAF